MANYSKITDKSNGNRPIQVESAIRDGEGKNIVNNYSKQNGYYANMGVGQADELSTTRQIENPETACPPIVMGITGGSAEIKTGIEKFEYLEGNSFAFNQLVQNGNFADNSVWVGANGTLSVSNNVGTYTLGNNGTAERIQDNSLSFIKGHKYFVCATFLSSKATAYSIRNAGENIVSSTDLAANTKTTSNTIYTPSNDTTILRLYINNSGLLSQNDTVQFSNVMVIDLTLIYGAGNEPTTVAEFKSRFPLDYYSYNSGSILSAKTNALISRGRQQWDEQWESGGIYSATGLPYTDNNKIRSKNFIPVVNGEKYYFYLGNSNANLYVLCCYDENYNYISDIGYHAQNSILTMPTNACYIKFCMANDYGTTYHNDITISIYFEDGEGYDEYYAYSQDSVELPNIELRAIGDLKDIAYASGGGKRRLGYVDLGSLSWNYTSGRFITSSHITEIKSTATNFVKANIVCAIYTTATASETESSSNNKTIAINRYSDICVQDSSYNDTATFKTAMSGIYLLFELDTETDLTENTGWDDTIAVDNYGTLEFTTNPQQVPQVPQPYFIKYTISLKELLDSIYVNAGGDADDIVYEQELQSVVDNLENGTLVVAKAEVADNLTPYDDESGEEQTQPFALQGTGCGNGEQIVDTGSFAQLKEKQGNSVVVNNILAINFSTQTINGITFTKNNDGTISVSGTASAEANLYFGNVTSAGGLKAGHKYLITGCPAGGSNQKYSLWCSSLLYDFGNNGIASITNNDMPTARITIANGYAISGTLKFSPKVVDLTQWFGSNDNIPAYLLAHPESFFNYYRGSLAYNVGTLTNANGQNLKCIGRNVWDEEWESGDLSSSTGAPINSSTYIRSKNFNLCMPNTVYYVRANVKCYVFWYDENKNYISYTSGSIKNATTTSPSNACYYKITNNNSTYGNDITVSIYYEDESGYTEYYPYEVLTNVDTGTEVLRKAGSVKDYKTPDGTIHRLVGSVDLSTLSWTATAYGYSAQITDIKANGKSIASNYIFVDFSTDFNVNHTSGTFSITSKYIGIATSSLPTGTLYYELETETTEQGTPFNETLQINDFGSMYYDSEEYNGVPQGSVIFYPVDYKAMLDSLNNRIDGDVSELVIQSELTASESARDTVDSQLQNAIGGTLRQCLCVAKSLSFNNTVWVDLGTLTWEYNAERQTFVCYDNLKKEGYGNIMCTKYATTTANTNWGLSNKEISGAINSNYLYIKDSDYTDNTLFKNSLNGVLAAYEKMS